jgi:hypothetical protein
MNAPLIWADGLVAWLQSAVGVTTFGGDNARWFRSDAIAMWYEGFPSGIEALLLRSLGSALVILGEAQPDEFRRVIDRLVETPYLTPQMIVATAYSRLGPRYADDALAFLLADQRRMWIGTASALQTRQVITSIYPHLSSKQRSMLDNAILSYEEWRSSEPSNALQSTGVETLLPSQRDSGKLTIRDSSEMLGRAEQKVPENRYVLEGRADSRRSRALSHRPGGGCEDAR